MVPLTVRANLEPAKIDSIFDNHNEQTTNPTMVKAPSLLSSRVGALSHSGVPSQTTVSSTSSYYKKKYKSWRKGKSTKHSVDGTSASGGTKHHGSLKQQLRGLIRLQQKKKKDRESNVAANDDERDEQQEQELQEKIDALQEQIQMREITEKERTNAKKSHKLRFIDRQRTTRLYQYYMKKLQLLQPSESKDNINDDLYRLALDQVYVAHFPLDRTSYVSLFNPSNAPVSSSDSAIISAPPQQQQQRRTVMNNRLLHKMATQRQCIMERLHQSTQQDSQNTDNGDNDNVETEKNSNRNANTNKRRIQPVSWIHPSQYERIQHLTTWSTQLERTTFNITIVNNTTSSNDDMMESPELSTTGNTGAKQNTDDDRFHGATSTFNSTQQLLLQEQERIERELSALEETDQKERNQSTAKQYHATKATASVTKYNTNESDSSDEDHSDDEVDDANVDPLSRSVADDVPKETLEQRNDNRIAGGDDDDDEDDSDDSDSMESEQSSDSESDTDQDDASSSIDRNDNDKKEEGVSHDDVIATATNLRKMASQRGHASFHNNNNTRKSGNMEEEDDFFVALDEVDQKEPTSNVFANAKRDTIRYNNSSSNGIGDKSQGWATQKQLPGQFRKKQRRR